MSRACRVCQRSQYCPPPICCARVGEGAHAGRARLWGTGSVGDSVGEGAPQPSALSPAPQTLNPTP